MNTTTAGLTVTNLTDATWTEGSRRVGFEAKGATYGIVNDRGQALSFNGVSPSVWDRKNIAQQIAGTIVLDDTLTWVEVA
jgi:hypothetical protein